MSLGTSACRAARPGRLLAFNEVIYARRNVLERCINRLKQWRGLATRHEKRGVNYRAMVVLASIVASIVAFIVLWLKSGYQPLLAIVGNVIR